ncbi:MAG: FAD:protein FMN transferase [Planctomycetota bacterium]
MPPAISSPHSSTAESTWLQERRELYHGIPVTLKALGCPAAVWDSVWKLLVDADQVFNRFAPASEISQLAQQPTSHGCQISPMLGLGIRAALHARTLTRGTADASIRPLVAIWRQAVADQTWPSDSVLAAAHQQCRLRDVSIDENNCLTVSGSSWCADLDLGGIIKGVLVDLAAERLRHAGVEHLLVQIGGETTVCGRSPTGEPWRLGLQHPLLEQETWLVLHAPPEGLSCSTSADYRRAWEIAGTPVSHLIDPRTGRPASPDLLTAHVAIPNCGRCSDCEALTKAVALMERTEADDVVTAVGGEWLHLEARDQGVMESRSHGFERLVGER